MHNLSIPTVKYLQTGAVLLILVTVIFSVSCSSKDLAPDFTLPDASGQQITLTSELENHRGVVIVFYRGFF